MYFSGGLLQAQLSFSREVPFNLCTTNIRTECGGQDCLSLLICMSWNKLEFLGIPRTLGIHFPRVKAAGVLHCIICSTM